MARASTGVALLALAALINAAVLSGQTQIKLPKNKYTPEQDVQIGRKAAAEVRQQYPIINDEAIRMRGVRSRLHGNRPREQ